MFVRLCIGVVGLVSAFGCGSSAVPTKVLERVSSPDGELEVLDIRADEGVTGGTAEQIEVLAKGDRFEDAKLVLSWIPTSEASNLKMSWDGRRRLRVSLSGTGSIRDFSNFQELRVGGKDEGVSVRLDAPFYGDEELGRK